MKRKSYRKSAVFAILLCLSMIISIMSVLALEGDISNEIISSTEPLIANNVKIREGELPFTLNTYQLDSEKIFVAFSCELQESPYVKNMANNEEILPHNGVYTLIIGNEYYYSVVVNALNATEYYSAIFEVSADDSDYIQYSSIVKNVVPSSTYDENSYSTMGYAQISESENANNNVSGAVETYSDADNVGTISTSNDVDWWKIKFNYNGNANFWLGNIPSGCNYSLMIYNAQGTAILQSSTNGGNSQEYISLFVVKDAYYTVKIISESGSNASSQYLMRIKNFPEFPANQVYTISNFAYSGKYLAIDDGYNANLQNVQMETIETNLSGSNYLNNYRMRISLHSSTDAYTISPICSYNGYGRALDVYNTGTIVNNANVQTWAAVDKANRVYANEQYFTFEECSNAIVIRLTYYTDFVLTANSSNVFISTYSSSLNTQRWNIVADTVYNVAEATYQTYDWGWMYLSQTMKPQNLNFTSSYGKRLLYGADDAHYGLDIEATNGTLVYSMTNGTVTQLGYKDGIENFVVVETEDNVYNSTIKLRILYQHMQGEELSVTLGEDVNRGSSEIGETGSGHMHLTVITDGENRLNADDFVPVSNSTRWYTLNFTNTINPLLFFTWDQFGFTYD